MVRRISKALQESLFREHFGDLPKETQEHIKGKLDRINKVLERL